MDILVTAISILGAIIVIGIIILVHELGHYTIGRACKIKIAEFGIGFGPKIKQWVKNDIIYSVRWFFIGGFTKFYGEDEEMGDKLAFNNQPAGRRALTIAAGPIYNIIFAFILVIFTLCIFGDYVPVITEVWEDSPAQAAGLQPGDQIVEMNGVEMDFYIETSEAQAAADYELMPITVRRGDEIKSLNSSYESFIVITEIEEGSAAQVAGIKPGDIILKINGIKTDSFIKSNDAESTADSVVLPITVKRNNEMLTFNLSYGVVQGLKSEVRQMAGFSYGGQPVTYGFFEAIALSFKYMYFILKSTILAIIGLFAGKGTQDLASLPTIVVYLGEAIKSSLQSVMQLGIAISISLAIMNLLPLPALDGGRLVFIAIEKIFRRPVPRNVEGIIHFAGFVAFIVIFILITYRDLARLFGG